MIDFRSEKVEDFFLVTTSDEQTWEINKRTLFLGEWCKLYSRKEQWTLMDSITLPYHWDDRIKLKEDYEYLKNLHEDLLQDLTNQLNSIHATNFSKMYWRIIIGPWLGTFVHIFFDRHASINNCLEKYKISGTILYDEPLSSLLPNDMNEFMEFLKSREDWNHLLFAHIIKEIATFPIAFKNKKKIFKNKKSIPKLSLLSILKQFFLTSISDTINIFFERKGKIVLINTYLPFWKEVKLLLKFRQLPFLGTIAAAPRFSSKQDYRNWNLEYQTKNKFELLLCQVIPHQLPKCYLEGFKKMQYLSRKLSLPKNPALIWTSNNHVSDDLFKIWAASNVENNTPLVIGQHGGVYGTSLFTFMEDHELSISNYYFSWGWRKKNFEHIIPIGQIKFKKPLRVNHFKNKNILLVCNMVPRYSYYLFSSTISSQWLNYQDDQYKFVSSLPLHLRNQLIVRLVPWDWGWSQLERWKDRFDNIIIDEGFTDINKLIIKTKIYISSYNATTFLESLTINIPTIIFWNPTFWELRDDAKPYFDELKRVNIFHETPESAASHLIRIWDDVEAWWNSEEVKNVLYVFKKKYCDMPNNFLEKIEFSLNDIIENNNNNKVVDI